LHQSHGGRCLPPEDPAALAAAILELQSDPARCARLGSRGREFVSRHYCRRRFAGQIAGLLESIAAPRVPTGAVVEV
jgi:glycosyltransferase involved in cell wall biosynthesis